MYSEKINFKQAKFYTTVNDLASLPRINQEIAIVGRSNAGKSSLLNTLTNQTRLAYTSKTPGRTQHINYFEVKEGVHLVDLPGYGYAKVPEAIRTHWVHLLGNYLQFRKEIIGLVLIMDARHPLKDLDIQMIASHYMWCYLKRINYLLRKKLGLCVKYNKQSKIMALLI